MPPGKNRSTPEASLADVREALGLPREGTPAEVAAAFAKSVGFKKPTGPDAIGYLNRLVLATHEIIGTAFAQDSTDAAAIITAKVREAISGIDEVEERAAAELGTSEHLNTFFFDFFAIEGYEALARAGLVHEN